jgi:hypothetical protein
VRDLKITQFPFKDWTAFEGLIVETAKWLYIEQNTNRSRVPRGFAKGFSLHISGVEPGSAIPVFERKRMDQAGVLFPSEHLQSEYSDWFDKARDRVLDVIKASAANQAIDALLPKHLMPYFDSFGRSLRESERIEFIRSGDDVPIVYDARIRKSIVLQTAEQYRVEELLRGSISELDVEKSTLTFKLINGRKIQGGYIKEVRQQAVEALSSYGEALVMAECVVVRDNGDNILAVENITRIETLDARDVPARLEALALLRAGWLDGQGMALPREGLKWLSREWAASWPEDLPLPYVYPMPSGDVQLEWTSDTVSTSAEINTQTKNIGVLSANIADGDVLVEKTFDMSATNSWQNFAAIVRIHHTLSEDL